MLGRTDGEFVFGGGVLTLLCEKVSYVIENTTDYTVTYMQRSLVVQKKHLMTCRA